MLAILDRGHGSHVAYNQLIIPAIDEEALKILEYATVLKVSFAKSIGLLLLSDLGSTHPSRCLHRVRHREPTTWGTFTTIIPGIGTYCQSDVS